jgi:hypothetical protein
MFISYLKSFKVRSGLQDGEFENRSAIFMETTDDLWQIDNGLTIFDKSQRSARQPEWREL